MFGIVNIDKPTGITSRTAAGRVDRLVKPDKVGHAGTLDPLATGVLLVCVGPATRLMGDLQELPKTYQATFLLGCSSNTEDTDGEVRELVNPPRPAVEDIAAALPRYTGRILQTPPVFSAVKVAGRRSYELARRQKEVELEPRPIDVYRLELLAYEYPRLELLIECGSGTYVRSLGRDLAESLGTGAVMSALRRTAIGPYRAEDGVLPIDLTAEVLAERLISPLAAVNELPRVELSDDELVQLSNGVMLADPHQGQQPRMAGLDTQGRLQAILVPHGKGLVRAYPNFVHYYRPRQVGGAHRHRPQP